MEEVELLPFQGAITCSLVPRAMPWAKCLLAFQAVSTQGFHNLRNLNEVIIMVENTFNYRKRIADILLEEKLDAMGAVLIEGPKACGKTTTAKSTTC